MRISDWSSDVCSSDLMVFQHFSLFDTLTVAENIALGLPKDMRLDALEGRIADTARQYGLDLEPRRHVPTLSVGERQRGEIVRALLGRPPLLILRSDERRGGKECVRTCRYRW